MHDFNKSTPPVGMEVSEQLVYLYKLNFRLGAYNAHDNAQC